MLSLYTAPMFATIARFWCNYQHLVWVALGVTVLHLVIFFGTAALLASHGGSMANVINHQDEQEYVSIAHSMIALGEFRINGGVETETFRTIGYPAFAAFILLLTAGSFWAIYMSHTLITGLTAAITTWVAELIGLSRRTSIVAGILFGLSSGPFLLTTSGMGSDKIFPLLYALSAALLLTFTATNRLKRAALMGAIMGIATLVRPIGILASLPLFTAILFVPPLTVFPTIPERVRATTIALLVFIAVMVPWHYRNYELAGRFSLSSLPVYNFVYYNIPLYLAGWEGKNEIAERDRIIAELGNPNLMTLRGYFYHDELAVMQKEFIKEKVVPYTLFHVYKMIPFFLGSGFNVAHAILAVEAPSMRSSLFPTEQENLTSAILRGDYAVVWRNITAYPVVTLERLSWLIIFGLAFLSPLFAPAGPLRRFLVLASLFILSMAFLSSPVIQPRYRVPIEPLLWPMFLYCLIFGYYTLLSWYKNRGFAKQKAQL